ncbi:MAG TPA: hypothetical protein VI320_07585 [Terracidiphilus sp.]
MCAQPDPSNVREFADDVRDGKFVLPVGGRTGLRDAAEAHVLGENGGIGKILLLAPAFNAFTPELPTLPGTFCIRLLTPSANSRDGCHRGFAGMGSIPPATGV